MDSIDRELPEGLRRGLARAEADEAAAGDDPAVDDDSVGLDEYRRLQRLRAAARAMPRHRIYLDTNYWVWLRDAASGEPKLPAHLDLWHALSAAADAGRVACPLSYPVYAEVMRQDADSRRRTAAVVDRLAGGTCLANQFDRMSLELSHLVWTELLGDRTLPPVEWFVWCPVAHVMSMPVPRHPGLDEETSVRLGKRWLRFTEFLRFSDVVEGFADGSPRDPPDPQFARRQDFMSGLTRYGLRSLEATYRVEVGGSTDLFAEALGDLAGALFARGVRTGIGPERTAAELADSLACVVTAGLQLGRITTRLPQQHVGGAVHALNRWARRPHRGNDLQDHAHAKGALPYCHAFFTERGLRDALMKRPFLLADAYDCRVVSDPVEAAAHVRAAGGPE